MLNQYNIQTQHDRINSIKQVIQEVVLCGLSRAGFFKNAAFYGETALRIFYGLDRFSEDLDFSLKTSDSSFDFNEYLPILEKEIRSYGLNFDVSLKQKSADTNVTSAFLKGNTKEHILMFYSDELIARSINSNELIKIKVEVDTDPPPYACFETKYQLLPIPYEISLYDVSSLFAGKIHAILCRSWKNRIKGRDLYDYIFYLSRKTPVNLKHLAARLIQTGNISENIQISINDIKKMLYEKFNEIDYSQAKQDALPFIKNTASLDIWKADFFCKITEQLSDIGECK
jgi:predicted nucleotidyltransferase component of viral defense system